MNNAADDVRGSQAAEIRSKADILYVSVPRNGGGDETRDGVGLGPSHQTDQAQQTGTSSNRRKRETSDTTDGSGGIQPTKRPKKADNETEDEDEIRWGVDMRLARARWAIIDDMYQPGRDAQ